MFDLINLYKERLGLESAKFTLIEHDDAIVAIVYQIELQSGHTFILKICKAERHFLREVYFLKLLAGKILVPKIEKIVQPGPDLSGAILMECLSGKVLKIREFTDELAFEMGAILAKVHLNRTEGYGEGIQPQNLTDDPRLHFTEKFEEGFEECAGHLPAPLLKSCKRFYESHLDLLKSVDGPSVVHRDYRPGNLIVDKDKIQGVIDWSSGRFGFAEEDFSSMEHGEWSVCAKTKPSFLKGYASIRPVPNYDSVMPLLRLSKAIATIGYLVKRGLTGAYLYQLNRRYLDRFE